MSDTIHDQAAQLLTTWLRDLGHPDEAAQELADGCLAVLAGDGLELIDDATVTIHLDYSCGAARIGGAPVEAVAGRVAAGEAPEVVAEDYRLSRGQVLLACRTAARYGDHTAVWHDWAQEWEIALRDRLYDEVPAPPAVKDDETATCGHVEALNAVLDLADRWEKEADGLESGAETNPDPVAAANRRGRESTRRTLARDLRTVIGHAGLGIACG